MSTTVQTVEVALTNGTTATTYYPRSLTYESSVNGGINWKADLRALATIDWDEDDEWTIAVSEKGSAFAAWGSPTLVCTEIDTDTRGGAGTMSIGGQCKTSFLLEQQGLTIATISDTFADHAIETIATAAGISTSFLGSHVLDTLRLREYDCQGEDNTYGSHIVRILRDGGCNYRIGGTDPTKGYLEMFPISYDVDLATVSVIRTTRQIRLGRKNTQIWLRKTSKQAGQFIFSEDSVGVKGGDIGPIGLAASSLSVSDLSTSGSIGYVAFYSGASATGTLVALFELNPQYASGITDTPNQALTALSCVFAVHPPTGGSTTVAAKLLVQGTPPGAYAYDLAFTSKYPGTDTSARKRKFLIESPLWMTQAHLETANIHRDLLWESNKSNRVVRRDVVFNPNVMPGGCMDTDDDAPKARYDTVSWQVGGGAPRMTIAGFEVPW